MTSPSTLGFFPLTDVHITPWHRFLEMLRQCFHVGEEQTLRTVLRRSFANRWFFDYVIARIDNYNAALIQPLCEHRYVVFDAMARNTALLDQLKLDFDDILRSGERQCHRKMVKQALRRMKFNVAWVGDRAVIQVRVKL